MPVTEHIEGAFEGNLAWLDALDHRSEVYAGPAVYALMAQQAFQRLIGQSWVLYIGHSRLLGGESDRARFYGYRFHPYNLHSGRIRLWAQTLIDEHGWQISLRWHIGGPENAARDERKLLIEHQQDHCELPPFNRRNE